MENELIQILMEELQKKSENEKKLIIALCNVIKSILIAITIISVVAVISYFWSPQTYDEYNQDSKNFNLERGGIDG